MQQTQPLTRFKIGLFVDGFTLRKVNEYYRFQNPDCNGINLLGLKNWVAAQASRYFWPNRPLEMMSHYYHPYRNPELDNDYRHRNIMHFADEIVKAGFSVHFASLDYAHSLCPNMALKEDALLYAQYNQLDALVLVSTQGQFGGLPSTLLKQKIPTLLLGWNFKYTNNDRTIHWHTDQNLRHESTYYIPMERIMDKEKASRDVLAQDLFLLPRMQTKVYPAASADFPRGMSKLA